MHWWQQYATGILRFVFFESLGDKKYGIGKSLSHIFGTPEGTRTPDLLIRSQSLYPTELPAHVHPKCLCILAHGVGKCKPFFQKYQKFFFFLEMEEIEGENELG